MKYFSRANESISAKKNWGQKGNSACIIVTTSPNPLPLPLGTPSLLFVSGSTYSDTHISGMCDWDCLPSFSVMFAGFIHVVARTDTPFFSMPNDTLLYGYTYCIYPFIR